jgi:hypothetical protein
MRARLAVVLALFLSPGASGDEVVVIPLRHRTLDQVLPVLQPLVDPGGALSGMGDSLIVRSSPENIEQIREVLSAIDTAPRTVMISVRQNNGEAGTRRGAGVTGRIGPDGGSAGIRIEDSRRAEEDKVLQRVRTLEGNPAYIAIGQSVPIPSGYATYGPGGVVVQETVTMRDYTTGFTVVPRLSGDRVTLEIGTSRDRPIGYAGAAHLQDVATTVSGRLGEWIDLGGVGQASADEERSLTSASAGTRNRGALIQVRVDEVR